MKKKADYPSAILSGNNASLVRGTQGLGVKSSEVTLTIVVHDDDFQCSCS